MKSWFTSLAGAVTLSVIALLTELWRAFLDFQHEYSNFLNSTGAVLLGTLLYTAFFGGWAWALLRAMRRSRSALIAALIINLLFLLVLPIGALVAYRQRGPLLIALCLFSAMPLYSLLDHWYASDQRNHWFGYWFGHDMFTPPFKEPDGKAIYPEMARNAVLFGGTDPGRFCPTYMIFCESFTPHHAQPARDQKFDRRDVYIITQNALADDTTVVGGKGAHLGELSRIGGIRVPALVHWPSRLKPGMMKYPMHVADWMPTLCRLVGYQPPRDLKWDGRDVWPLLCGEKPAGPRTLYWGYAPVGAAVRQGDWKLITYSGRRAVDELFDLAHDPYEKDNLALRFPARVVELRKVLGQQAARDNDALVPEEKPVQSASDKSLSHNAAAGDRGRSCESVAMAAMRAVENGSYLVRAANTGVSAVIAPSGAILAQTPLFVETGIVGTIHLRAGETPYTRYGDVLAWGCTIFLAGYGVALLWSLMAGPRAARPFPGRLQPGGRPARRAAWWSRRPARAEAASTRST